MFTPALLCSIISKTIVDLPFLGNNSVENVSICGVTLNLVATRVASADCIKSPMQGQPQITVIAQEPRPEVSVTGRDEPLSKLVHPEYDAVVVDSYGNALSKQKYRENSGGFGTGGRLNWSRERNMTVKTILIAVAVEVYINIIGQQCDNFCRYEDPYTSKSGPEIVFDISPR